MLQRLQHIPAQTKPMAGAGAGGPAFGQSLVDYPSLCRVFMPCIANPGRALTFEPFALLVDACDRECLVLSAMQRKKTCELLVGMIGDVVPSAAPPSTKTLLPHQRQLLLAKVQAVFRVSRTNCGPFAVVGLCHMASDDVRWDLDKFQASVTGRKVTPAHFLATHRPAFKRTWTEVALFVHGAMHLEAGTRRDGAPICDPEATVQAALDTVHGVFQAAARGSAHRQRRSAVRAAALMDKMKPKAACHSVVKQFTAAEVAALNMSRDPANRLEWNSDTALLRLHCCYPDCPDFLGRKFASRKHLAAHLGPGRYTGNYLQGFHVKALPLARKCASVQELRAKLQPHFPKAQWEAAPHLDAQIESVFHFVHRV